jgi:hydrogenase maturation protein HypF
MSERNPELAVAALDKASPANLFSQLQHLEIRVSGTVQGVGFRPFVYVLARARGLVGVVWNNSQGVVIRAQGGEDALAEFISALRSEAPAAARVVAIVTQALAPADYTEFRILPSEHLAETFTQVSPDLAICPACWRELEEVGARRKDYPFTNCTACGPRFTIIRSVPYDRPQTTMADFELCADCRAEYEDPTDRRFHAQPIACPECGPVLRCLQMTDLGWREQAGETLDNAVAALQQGRILLVQGLGGFHLACDARDGKTMAELRRRKQRDEKPFAVMFPDAASLEANCDVGEIERNFLSSYRAPILLLKKEPESEVAEEVAPGNPCLGALLPYTPLHRLLLRAFDGPLVMTSANLSDEPIAFQVDDALERMRGIADVALVHNRAIHMFADDSVVKVAGGKPRVWRRSRGYVPEAVHVPVPFRAETLAFGPQMKNTFCLGKREFAILSQHLGDLENDAAITAQQHALEHFLKLYDAKIGRAACDLHPDYTTTRLAEAWCAARAVPLVRVQHHHAHLAACLAENATTARAIGLCLDGTGYGTDGTVWGGEVLVGDLKSFVRAGHLLPVSMPGGERAAKEPWRMAFAWLSAAFGDELWTLPLDLLRDVRAHYDDSQLHTLLHPGLNATVFPRTSSLGRLFDAVAALLFFGSRRQHEGQAAMLLEGMIAASPAPVYPLDLTAHDGVWILSPLPMFHALADDLRMGLARDIIARRFHETLIDGFARLCAVQREQTGVATVALSGGCFQNAFLLTGLETRLAQDGFRVLSHQTVPSNDGGVALGQAVIANAQDD